MKSKYSYKDLEDTLLKLKVQVIDSLKYADKNYRLTGYTPGGIFLTLKYKIPLIYFPDPPDVELLQSFETLVENNKHGCRGCGDCDCFVIAGLATLLVNGYTSLRIVLAGRSKDIPVHIYIKVTDRGKWRTFDLTNAHYNQERTYPHKQELIFKV